MTTRPQRIEWLQASGADRSLLPRPPANDDRRRRTYKLPKRTAMVEPFESEINDTAELTQAPAKYRWLDDFDHGKIGFTVYLDGEPVPKSLVLKECVVCARSFPVSTYLTLLDEAYDDMGLPDDILILGRKYFKRIRRCSYCRGAEGMIMRGRRSQRLVAALVGHLKSRGTTVVRGRARRHREMDFYTLYHRSFSVLGDNRGLNTYAEVPVRSAWDLKERDWRDRQERGVMDSLGLLRVAEVSMGHYVATTRLLEYKGVVGVDVLSFDDSESYSHLESDFDSDEPRRSSGFKDFDSAAAAAREARRLQQANLQEDAEARAFYMDTYGVMI